MVTRGHRTFSPCHAKVVLTRFPNPAFHVTDFDARMEGQACTRRCYGSLNNLREQFRRQYLCSLNAETV